MSKDRNTLPSFSRGKLENLTRAIAEGRAVPPIFHFLTDEDKKCLAFVDIDGTIYELGLKRIEQLEKEMTILNDSMGDLSNIADVIPPESGATNIVEYISSINEAVNSVSNTVTMITSGNLGNKTEEETPQPNPEPGLEPEPEPETPSPNPEEGAEDSSSAPSEEESEEDNG